MRALLTCLIVGATVSAGPAIAACRLALAFGLDVSGSVDASEYRQQIDGLTAALLSDQVQNVLFSDPNQTISLFAFEWSASSYQKTIATWTDISDANALADFTGTLAAYQRSKAPFPTSIGAAMKFGFAALDTVSNCGKLVLDLSGDGTSNDWPPPKQIRNLPEMSAITINALVIGNPEHSDGSTSRSELDELAAYFRANVIRGPGSFVERAAGFDNYQTAMERKLIREITSFAIGQSDSPHFAAVSPAAMLYRTNQ